MNRIGNWLALIFAAGCLALGFGYWQQQQRISVLQVDNNAKTLVAQNDQREIANLRKKVAEEQAADKARQKKAEEARKARASIDAARADNSDSRPTILRYSDIIKDHPEFAALRDKEVRRNVIRQYGDAIATLNLPPDKAAQLKNLLVEKQLSVQDAQEAAQAAGLKMGTQEFFKATAQATQDVEQQIVDLVGKEGMQTLQQSQIISGYKNMVTFTYAPAFQDAGVPLTAEQETTLAQALSSNMRNISPEARTSAYRQPDPDTWLSPADQQTLAKAAQTLSPAQVDLLKGELADQNHRNAIMQPYWQAARRNGNNTITIMQ